MIEFERRRSHAVRPIWLDITILEAPATIGGRPEAFRRRGKLVVADGPFATLSPEELRGRVDVLVVGETEYTWLQFVPVRLHQYRPGRHIPPRAVRGLIAEIDRVRVRRARARQSQ